MASEEKHATDTKRRVGEGGSGVVTKETRRMQTRPRLWERKRERQIYSRNGADTVAAVIEKLERHLRT